MDLFSTAAKYISISNNGKTVTGTGGNWPNAYGTVAIKSTSQNKYVWKFTIMNKGAGSMFIGITSHKNINASYSNIDYSINGYDGKKWSFNKTEEYGVKFNKNDQVDMTVDFERNEMSFIINGKHQGIAYSNIKIGPTYYLVVSIGYNNESISINEFKCIGNMEEKEKEITSIQSEHDKLKNENNTLTQRVKTLQQQKQELTTHYEKMLNEALNMQQNQKQKIVGLEQEINELKMVNGELLDDKKEMELQINELKQENERLNKNNLDYSKWRKWDSKQVYYFIMDCVNDGSLDEYENDIKKEIFEAEYSGKDLADIDSSDVKAMGIKKISVRKTVFRAIQNLTQNKPEIVEGIGANAPTAFI